MLPSYFCQKSAQAVYYHFFVQIVGIILSPLHRTEAFTPTFISMKHLIRLFLFLSMSVVGLVDAFAAPLLLQADAIIQPTNSELFGKFLTTMAFILVGIVLLLMLILTVIFVSATSKEGSSGLRFIFRKS
jgi:hypothetical protein